MSNETNMSASLAKSINDHCRAFEASDEFGEMVHSHVRKLYEDAIKDVFRWGKFPDAVKKALQDALPANISEMADLSRYNLLLARSLQDEWNKNAVSERTVSHMHQLVKDFIEQDQVPKFIKASDLWAAYVEEHQEEAAHEQWMRPEVIVKTDSEYGKYFQIGLCKEPAEEPGRYSHRRTKTEYFECDTHLGFSLVKASRDRDAEPLMQDGHEVYSLYTGKLEYSDTLGKRAIQFRSQFERLVGALYYGDSLLVLDDEADDIYYPGEY